MSLSTPILIERPASIRFGCGLVREVGAYARAQGCQRILVVADAFNAGRVDLLELPGTPTVFGAVRPEPDIPNLEALLAMATEAAPDLVIGFGGGSAMDLGEAGGGAAGQRSDDP